MHAALQLQGKTDQRFVETAFKLFRDAMGLKLVITAAQFLEQGFAERKVLLLCDAIGAVRRIHAQQARQERLGALKSYKQVGGGSERIVGFSEGRRGRLRSTLRCRLKQGSKGGGGLQ